MDPHILLRPWKKEDAKQLAHITNNKNIWNNLRDSIPFPYTLKNAQEWIAHCSTQNPVVNFAVVYNSVIAGNIGCVPKTDVYRNTIEIGYFIDEAHWGKGIATEAVRILTDYIQKHFKVVRIYAEVFAHNKASMKVLRSNGFFLESIRRKAAIKNNQVIDDYVWVKLL
jgi:[ribosomal protein S5]-alanine N-acetyltransferase